MFKNFNLSIKEYIRDSPKLDKINWQDIPDSIKLKLDIFPDEIKKFGNFITIRRLKLVKKDKKVAKNIIGIKRSMTGNKWFKIKLPIMLKNKVYSTLYALMISEGSYKTEFSLNVPEKEFHDLFRNCIKNLISEEAANLIRIDYNKQFLRSRAPAIIRHIIPFPEHIPLTILKNRELAREYLKVAFEAEGSPILNKSKCKRYIKLSRYTDISSFISNEKFTLKKRIYVNAIKVKYPKLFEKIKEHPPKILLGEQILLKKHFDIDTKLQLEAIRKNKTDLRAGKITARWVLFIYAHNINKFIKEIGFISKKKNGICTEMMKIKTRRPKYYNLKIINKIQKDKFFYSKAFVKEMKKIGYKSPRCYLQRFSKQGLIKKISRGYYKIIF